MEEDHLVRILDQNYAVHKFKRIASNPSYSYIYSEYTVLYSLYYIAICTCYTVTVYSHLHFKIFKFTYK